MKTLSAFEAWARLPVLNLNLETYPPKRGQIGGGLVYRDPTTEIARAAWCAGIYHVQNDASAPRVAGWLIRFQSSADDPSYYGMTHDQMLGVTDREHAVMFETRDAATKIIREVGWTEAVATPALAKATPPVPEGA